MQAATNEQHSSGSGSVSGESVSKTLHIQAAKVVAAHAASVGDNLLGVPLLCSAGKLCFCRYTFEVLEHCCCNSFVVLKCCCFC